MKITLRQLQVFDAVATLGSVTAAATRLNMSQSAASGAITDLQVILRRTLFAHAKGRSLQITDEGKRLQTAARSLLGMAADIERACDDDRLSGTLVIGATATIAETVLPRLCVEFMALHPDVQIRVEVASATDLFSRMVHFELETALVGIFPDLNDIEIVNWRNDELVLVATPDHVLAGRNNLKIEDLAGMAWCLREARSSTASHLRFLLHERAGKMNVAFQSTSNWAVRHAVLAGGGIGCLSRALVQFDLDNGRLVQLDVAGFAYQRTLSLARPKNIWRSRLTTAFDSFLLDRGEMP